MRGEPEMEWTEPRRSPNDLEMDARLSMRLVVRAYGEETGSPLAGVLSPL